MGKRKKAAVSSKRAGEILAGPCVRLANRLAEVVIDGVAPLQVKDREIVIRQILGRLSAACPRARPDPGPRSDEQGE